MSGSEIPHLFFRWLHVLASVMWVGQLWSLAIVQRTASVEAADASAAGVALRAHGWMRWSGTAAWATGVLLLGIVYYGGGAATGPEQSVGVAAAAGLGALVAGWILYDTVWRLVPQRVVATLVSLALLAAATAALSRVMTGRAVFIHSGAMLATIMLANTWERIWPVEGRRLSARDPLAQPSRDLVATAALRIRHNAALAVAVLLFMVSNHFPVLYGEPLAWLVAPGIVGVAALMTPIVP